MVSFFLGMVVPYPGKSIRKQQILNWVVLNNLKHKTILIVYEDFSASAARNPRPIKILPVTQRILLTTA